MRHHDRARDLGVFQKGLAFEERTDPIESVLRVEALNFFLKEALFDLFDVQDVVDEAEHHREVVDYKGQDPDPVCCLGAALDEPVKKQEAGVNGSF